jgi:hypothetical protein
MFLEHMLMEYFAKYFLKPLLLPVGAGTMLQAGKSRVRFPVRSLGFSIYLILLTAV